MNRDQVTMEECRATWRDEARNRAKQDVQDDGLGGDEAERFFQVRMAEHYAELEKLGDV